MSDFTATANNVNRWISGLYSLESTLTEQLYRSKDEVTATLDGLGLPRCGLYGASAAEIALLPAIPEKISSDYVVWHILPASSSGKRMVRLKVDRGIALAKLHDDVQSLGDAAASYNVLLSDYFENEYGGNIVINPSGDLLVDFGPGAQGNYAGGEEPGTLAVTSSPNSHGLLYSFSDIDLQKAIRRMLRPLYGNTSAPISGYYEFALYREGDTLQHVFFDARTDEGPFNDIPSSAIHEIGRRILASQANAPSAVQPPEFH